MRFIYPFLILLLPWLLSAQELKNPLEIRLISEMQTVAAGQPFHVGLHLNHPAGYHTYWKFPGIVGVATKIEWDLPPGFTAGEIEWPAPERVQMASYTAQGYHGETLLMVAITPPLILTSPSVHLAAKVTWMCCAKGCHPAIGIPFSIDLPVTSSAMPDPSTQPLFEKYRAQVARPDPSWRATVKRGHGHFLLTLQPPMPLSEIIQTRDITFFTADGQVDSDAEQRVHRLASGDIQLELPISEHATDQPTLPGVVSFPAGWCGNAPPLQLEIAPSF